MKILLGSHAFAPAIGGIESCSLALAREFIRLGHEVQVLTQTPRQAPADDHGLDVIRKPKRSELFRVVRGCDVFFQNNVSLQTMWPLVFVRRPWVVCTQTWLLNPDSSVGWGNQLKRQALRWATNVYISRAVRDHVGYPGHLVPNPYDSTTFRLFPEIARQRSLIFLGRLVSDKGVDLLLQALKQLKDRGMSPSLSIIGNGPERNALESLSAFLGLDGQVTFYGAIQGEKLAAFLNRHRCMVIPSRWAEPFGIVALEGIGCGCMVVGSNDGGLAEAIGPCGITFPNGDVPALANAIERILTKSSLQEGCLSQREKHLKQFTAETVAGRYLEIFDSLVK